MAGSHMSLGVPIRAGAIAFFAAACVGSGSAHAEAPGYQIQVGVVESDNIQRLPSGGNDETIATEELDFTWHEQRPWLDADVNADLNHLDYFPHIYSDELIGNFIGQARLNLAPQVFSWDFSDNFGQAPLNPLAPITPNNLQNINYFTTGPELSLPLGRTTQLDATATYGRVDYQQAPLDSTRLTGALGLSHEISPVSSISVTARDERVDFQNAQLNPDYELEEAFARFDTKGSRTELGVDLGYSRTQMPGFHDGTPLVRLDLSRRVSASSTLGLALGHVYSDGADAFRLVQGLGGANLNTQPIIQSNAAFVDSFATLAWNFQHARTTLKASASYFRDRYQTEATLNNDRVVVDLTAARQIAPTVQLALTEHAVRWQFNDGFNLEGGTATESDTGLELTWHVGNHLSVFMAYYLSKGSSDVPTFNYTENRVWLAIGWGRAAQVPPGPPPVRLPVMQ
jgi:hypothetical protein